MYAQPELASNACRFLCVSFSVSANIIIPRMTCGFLFFFSPAPLDGSFGHKDSVGGHWQSLWIPISSCLFEGVCFVLFDINMPCVILNFMLSAMACIIITITTVRNNARLLLLLDRACLVDVFA